MKKNVSRKVSKISPEFFNGLSKSNKQAVKKSSTNKNSRNLKRAKKTDVSTYNEGKPIFQEYIKSSSVSAKRVFNVF